MVACLAIGAVTGEGNSMTHFLISDENPQGHKLEDILSVIRKDIFYRSTKILDDNRPEARSVLENNVKILSL